MPDHSPTKIVSPTDFQGFNPADRKPVDFLTPQPNIIQSLWLASGLFVPFAAPSILTIDLSHWNGDIDPAALRASGVVAVILKCSEGAEGTYYEYKDTKFERNYRILLDAGFPVMLYHFFRGEKGSAEKSWFMKCADGFLSDSRVNGKTAAWLDCEWKPSSMSRATYTRRAFGFNSLITGEGMQNGVYSSPGLVPALFDPAETDWDSVNQWNAHWTRALKDTLPYGWLEEKRKVWQFAIYPTHDWAPVVNGAGTVDINHGYWPNEEALRYWLGQLTWSGSESASPSPSPSPSPAPDCCEEHDLRLDTIEAGMQVLTEIQQAHSDLLMAHGANINDLMKRLDKLEINVTNMAITLQNHDREIATLREWIKINREQFDRIHRAFHPDE